LLGLSSPLAAAAAEAAAAAAAALGVGLGRSIGSQARGRVEKYGCCSAYERHIDVLAMSKDLSERGVFLEEDTSHYNSGWSRYLFCSEPFEWIK
jgi:hypothetical protein